MVDNQPPASTDEQIDQTYVLERYKDSIKYYWGASRHNKRAYRQSRSLAIILGALVTLISSLASASFIEDHEVLNVIFSVATPIVAATLTIIGGFAQSFHWGATWRDMVINAERLEKERDRLLATKPEDLDLKNELEILNSLIIDETRSFFRRVLDSEIKPKDGEE
ncbi:MAG: DUF4231 domain-containing protein [Chloroflexi bacterium]|nr:DUF4231 domain-containing protein [Chloroflexota bacterium]